jgi:hypothetical protein
MIIGPRAVFYDYYVNFIIANVSVDQMVAGFI